MMNRVLKVVAGTMMVAGLFVSNVQAKEVSETGNNVLKAGRIVGIEYSENPESTDWRESLDKMYFEVDGEVYLYYDFAEDMFVGDDVLVTMNTRGTASLKDDVIRDYRYWRPDLESENGYFDEVENGVSVGTIEDVSVSECGMQIDFEDGTGYWYELDDEELQEHLYDLAKSLRKIVNKKAKRG